MRQATTRPAFFRRTLLAWWITAVAAFAGAMLMAAGQACAAVTTADFEAAFQQFQRAADGDTRAIEPAAEQFDKLSVSQPGDPVLLAYSGAAIAMRARTTMLPWRQMSFADEGLARLDKALTMLNPEQDMLLHRGTPGSLETRFVAATTFLRLPAMFNRHGRGTRLLDEVLKSPLFATAPIGFRAAVWMRAGDEAAQDKRKDDARRWLQQVADSGAPQAARAKALLKELNP